MRKRKFLIKADEEGKILEFVNARAQVNKEEYTAEVECEQIAISRGKAFAVKYKYVDGRLIERDDLEEELSAQEQQDAEKEVNKLNQLKDFKENIFEDLDGMNIPPRVRKFLKYLVKNEIKSIK